MKLEDLMDHYNLDNGELLPTETLSAAESAQILQQTLSKAGLKPFDSGEQPAAGRAAAKGPAGRPSKRKAWTLAAACIVVLAMATASFAAMALDKNFFDFFSAKNQDQMNMLGNLGTLIDKQIIDSGTTVHIREAVGDANSVNLLFDITAPEGTSLGEEYYSFNQTWIDFPNLSAGAGYYFQQLTDDHPTDNKISMMLCYTADTNLSGQTMRLRLHDLTAPKNAAEMAAIDALPPRAPDEPGTPGDAYDYNKVILPGSWETEFPLVYTDSSTVIKPNADVELYGDICKIKKVRYSPISVTMEIKGTSILKYDSTAPEDRDSVITIAGSSNQDIAVKLKDGTAVTTNGTGTSSRGNKLTVTCQFTSIVDPDDIESISYAGTTISIE